MAAPDAVTHSSPGVPQWQSHWLAETLRLREEHWGPLEDADAVRHARQGPQALEPRILLRAQSLGRREGLDQLIGRWRQGAAISLAILFLLAILTGIGSAAGALGDGASPVNVLWALGALLGVNLLTFLLWLASLLWRPRHATGLGRLWLWITRKLARGPDAALVPQALMNLWGRVGAIRGLFGAISHGLWLAGLTAALMTLLILLSTASYRFVWATTILQPDSFVRFTQATGWLPARLGFALPSEAVVRASDGLQALPAAAQTQWSVWLIGLIVVYGILPRLVAGLWCVVQAGRTLRGLRIDPALPGYTALRDRLLPAASSTGIDRPVQGIHQPLVGPPRADSAAVSWGTRPVLVSLELPDDLTWPPKDLPATIQNAGNLDSREQRNRVRDTLSDSLTPRLLVACDARQTPDRGTLGLIASLAELAGDTRVWLYLDPQREHVSDRRAIWRERLLAADMPNAAVLHNEDQPLRWLETGNG